MTLLDVTGTVPARCEATRSDGSGPCGRVLHDPESVRRRIGPECWDRLHPAPPTFGVRRAGEPGPGQELLPLDAAPEVTCPGCGHVHACPAAVPP
jgi:hypothetical protein